jgi:hypothetical protein
MRRGPKVSPDFQTGLRHKKLKNPWRNHNFMLVGAKFSAPVQAGPGNHPASCTMGTITFPGMKWPELGVEHPATSSAEVKERVELYL